MSLEKLIKAFEQIEELPVEITDARDALVALGIQDQIVFNPQDADPSKLCGVFYQFTKHPSVYAIPELCTLIVYSNRLPVAWQRVVCAKELIHVMDGRVEKTRTPADVVALLEKLLGPLSTEDFGLADFVAAKDKFALYQSLPILFPEAARLKAVAKFKAGEKTIEEIADWAVLPVPLTSLVMTDGWPAIHQQFCC